MKKDYLWSKSTLPSSTKRDVAQGTRQDCLAGTCCSRINSPCALPTQFEPNVVPLGHVAMGVRSTIQPTVVSRCSTALRRASSLPAASSSPALVHDEVRPMGGLVSVVR